MGLAYQVVPDGVESVYVSCPLGVGIGEHGGEAPQDVAEENDAKQHEYSRHPLLLSRGRENVSITEKRQENAVVKVNRLLR